eukprot:TRINITY_DN80375_c0_g1_i1.p1 TRINITY_DN80375_c0_g1~~TRINITY_DN80375_c0_g1_i1.p1  ORF type:complete len:1176 (+),score=130.90 TRINITY_DN80375_c0_g1_i1:88-3615(+)
MALQKASWILLPPTLVLGLLAVGLWLGAYTPSSRRLREIDGVNLCNVTQPPFSAKGDGAHLDTEALQAALDACAGQPGARGHVVIPPGTYLTASLRLPSHIHVQVQPGAKLLGVTDLKQYPMLEPLPSYCKEPGLLNAPLLLANNVADVLIDGGGEVNGGWGTDKRGVRLFQSRGSSDVHLNNVTIRDSGFWMIHLWNTRGASVTNCKIITGIRHRNTDGIDVDSSQNVYIANNHIETGDDGVAIKSGMDYCGRQFGVPSQNVTIERNFFNFTGGVAFGSESSGGIKDVLVQHNVLRGDAHRQPDLWTWGPRVVTIKPPRGRGGIIENIRIYNMTCIDCDQVMRVVQQTSLPLTNMTATPVVRNVTVELVRGTCEEPGIFQGLPEAPLGISMIDVQVTGYRKSHYEGCSLDSPYGIGIRNSPPACGLVETPRYLPRKHGGPGASRSTENFPSGQIFALSGVDGSTHTPSTYPPFVGLFMQENYSIHLWLERSQNIHLGFDKSADPLALEEVLVSTNDVLLVKRGASRLGITWLDWQTMVGVLEGAASVSVQDAGQVFCTASFETELLAVHHDEGLRWHLDHDLEGSGTCQAKVASVELLTSEGVWEKHDWITIDTDTPFLGDRTVVERMLTASADQTASSGASKEAGICMQGSRDNVFCHARSGKLEIDERHHRVRIHVLQLASCKTPKLLLAGDSRWLEVPTSGCRVGDASPDKDFIEIAHHSTGSDTGVTTFAISYDRTSAAAALQKAQSAAAVDVFALMSKRNQYILSLPPRQTERDDRFQRKLLSVMKVNSLSKDDGLFNHSWSTTARVPHRWTYLWDGMFQTLAMNAVDPALALEYIRSFVAFQNDTTGQMCATILPDKCSEPTNAMPPAMALTLHDNYLMSGNLEGVATLFGPLERYLNYNLNKFRLNTSLNLMRWENACQAGMDHEQTFCPTLPGECCKADHYSIDFTAYMIAEMQAMAKMASLLGMKDKEADWSAKARLFAVDLNKFMWDSSSGFFYDLGFDGKMKSIRSVAAFYTLLVDDMPRDRVAGLVKALLEPDFATAVPVPIVAVSTPGFSTDLDRGPMWLQQNWYIIKGLRKYGYDQQADEVRAKSVEVVRKYYEKWGVIFEFYDALDTTDPTQCLRKPKVPDTGPCVPGVPGLAGHCGPGGIREYNFCAGLALRWLRGHD